jgi:predicted short-subunit dehydrogenase-like oxidoreductase (DUF2520 family)
MNEIKNVAFIGTGRVAGHLAPALHAQGIGITGIYGRNDEETERLLQRVHSRRITDLGQLIKTDLILLTVTDDAIAEVAKALNPRTEAIVAHTSGAVPMNIIPESLRRAVFYPLQSFSRDKKIVWENVPFCLEAKADEDLNLLGELAELLSKRIHVLSSAQRKSLHLAAVFANNFANLMFEMAEDILEEADIDRAILHPLILETANKILMQKAAVSQTGPASRGDLKTIEMHREILGEDGVYREIYERLTREIYNRTHEEKL